MNTLNEREQLFAALGAAIGSNCVPCVERIVPKAKEAGIQDWELRIAVNIADDVRKRPAAIVLSTAKAIVDGVNEVEEDDTPCSLDQVERAADTSASQKGGRKWGCCG